MPTCPACARRYNETFERCSEDGTQLVPDRTAPTLSPGQTLDGGLTIRQLIGAGPSGEVYAAEHRGQGIAIKLLSPELSADQNFLKHLQRLMGHLAKLRHPGVAAVLPASGVHYQRRLLIAREFAGGQSVSELIRRTGPLPEERGLSIAMRVAEALTEAHRAGALHLNLKPSNVFVGDNDIVKLVDFGIGQRIERSGKVIYGDPRFLAPEQFEGKLVSFRSDIYGLGALLYFLVTARPPFQGTGADAEQAVTSARPTPPSTVEPSLAGHAKLDQVVLRALEKVPAKRYLSVQHFGRMMDGVMQEYHARSGGPPVSGRPPAHRTLPMGERAPTAPYAPPTVPQSGLFPDASLPTMEDTLRMEVPAELPAEDFFDGPTLRDRRPPPVPRRPAHDTVREGAPVPSQFQPHTPPAPRPQAVNHDTLRMAVAPAPVRPADTQPIPARPLPPPQQGQYGNVGAPHPPDAEPIYDDIGIDVVEEALYVPPLKKKRKKKKKKRPPVVAVRGEAALRLGPSTGAFRTGPSPAEAVMVDAQFLDEARGPERNLATMEIRVRPPSDISPAASTPYRAASPSSSGIHVKRKPRKAFRWVFAALALVILFLAAALGAAFLARWLSSSRAASQQNPPAVQRPIGSQ